MPAKKISDLVVDKNYPSSGRFDPVDIFVGGRIRAQRASRGLSQEDAAELLGVTLEKLQNYESGANRIGPSRLFEVSRILRVPISYFFDNMPNLVTETSTLGPLERMVNSPKMEEQLYLLVERDLDDRETLELVFAYYRISEDIRNLTLELIKSLATPEVTH